MDRRRDFVCVVTNFRIKQGLGIFIPAEYHWLHKKDSFLWRHFGQGKLSSVPAQAVKLGYEYTYSAGRFRFRLRFRESAPVGAKNVLCLTVQVRMYSGGRFRRVGVDGVRRFTGMFSSFLFRLSKSESEPESACTILVPYTGELEV